MTPRLDLLIGTHFFLFLGLHTHFSSTRVHTHAGQYPCVLWEGPEVKGGVEVERR